jgi:hypothetical protein
VPDAEKCFQQEIFSWKIIFMKTFSNKKGFPLNQTEPKLPRFA